MNTELAQMVSVVAYGNMFLGGHDIKIDLSHTTTDICHQIKFFELVEISEDEDDEVLIADTILQWYDYLKKEGVVRLNLIFTSEVANRMDAPFAGGGGRWIIEAAKGDLSDLYDVRWRTCGSSEDSSRIWTVDYGLTGKDISVPEIEYPPVSHWHTELFEKMTALRDTFTSQKMDEFAEIFNAGLTLLNDTSNPMSKISHHDLIPIKVYSIEAQQILAAAQKGYIIGMIHYIEGSTIEDTDLQAKKEELSDELFDDLYRSVMVATNSPKTGDFQYK